MRQMWTWWNSVDAVSTANLIAKWAGVIVGIGILLLGHRLTALQESKKKADKADSDRRETELRTTATSALQRAEAAEAKAKELGERTAQREIKPQDREKFITLLENAPKGSVEVSIDGSCGEEISTYAANIRAMIGAAGYDIGRQLGVSLGSPLPKGLAICIKNPDVQPAYFRSLHDALQAIGIEAKPIAEPNDKTLDEKIVRIYVGGKP